MSLPSPLLVVTDRHGAARPLAETVRAVLDGGARWIWFRDRDLAPAARYDLAVELLALVRAAGGRLSIGGDLALATAIGADGVHLGGSAGNGLPSSPSPCSEAPVSADLAGGPQDRRGRQKAFEGDASPGLTVGGGGEAGSGASYTISERVVAARRRLGRDRLVGLSAHSLAECRTAARAGADYVTLSPVFVTASKPGYGPALGLDALRAAATLGIPVVALGGIGPDEARACRAEGAAGVAVMGDLMRASDPAERTRALLSALS